MFRISTLISFVLIMGSVLYCAALLKLSHSEYVLWRHGKTAVVLPIEDYETHVAYKQGTNEVRHTYYVANLSARLDTGEVVGIPNKPVTMEQINASHQGGMAVVFLPGNPETNRFVDKEPRLLRLFLLSCAFSLASFLWFRHRRA